MSGIFSRRSRPFAMAGRSRRESTPSRGRYWNALPTTSEDVSGVSDARPGIVSFPMLVRPGVLVSGSVRRKARRYLAWCDFPCLDEVARRWGQPAVPGGCACRTAEGEVGGAVRRDERAAR